MSPSDTPRSTAASGTDTTRDSSTGVALCEPITWLGTPAGAYEHVRTTAFEQVSAGDLERVRGGRDEVRPTDRAASRFGGPGRAVHVHMVGHRVPALPPCRTSPPAPTRIFWPGRLIGNRAGSRPGKRAPHGPLVQGHDERTRDAECHRTARRRVEAARGRPAGRPRPFCRVCCRRRRIQPRRAQKELRGAVAAQGGLLAELPLDNPAPTPQKPPALELVELLGSAVTDGVLTASDAQLIAASRIAGIPLTDVAAARRTPARTLQRRRRDAERALVTTVVAA